MYPRAEDKCFFCGHELAPEFLVVGACDCVRMVMALGGEVTARRPIAWKAFRGLW